MSTYVIVDVKIQNPEEYEIYKQLTPDSINAFEGKFLTRGGQTEVVEDTWEPGRIIVLKFPSMKHAKQWWESEQYSKAKSIRQRAAKTNMIFVEGV